LASQQKRLEEDIKQLTTVNSQQALDLESQQAHTTYYQQQLTGSMEQVSLLQQEVQQLQEEIKAYRASEEQLQGDLKEAKSHISHLEEVQNKVHFIPCLY
jgi:peptidoglycan hydrolase CwlO-like protein